MLLRLKKTRLIHKENFTAEKLSFEEKGEIEKYLVSSQSEDEDSIEVSSSSIQAQLPPVPMKNPLKCDPRKISNLTESERNQIRQEHPEMSPYFFLNQRQKTKYFHGINMKYGKDIKLAEPPGSAPKKKTISFKGRFETRLFKEDEICEDIKKKKSRMELYRAQKKTKLKAKKSKRR